MSPSRRTVELTIARTAGYEDDQRTMTRLIITRRSASQAALIAAWDNGQRARRAKDINRTSKIGPTDDSGGEA